MNTAGPQGVFLVGCPRSGTTLLQSLMASHPAINTFPETHFFAKVCSRNYALRKLGVPRHTSRSAIQLMAELGMPLNQGSTGGRLYWLTVERFAKRFEEVVGAATQSSGATLWLEKTPRHLHHMDQIELHLPTSRFIHVVRDGPAVVASLSHVTSNHPELWGGSRDIETCIGRWNSDVELSLSRAGSRRHAFVSYERLVSDTEAVLSGLCRFLSLKVSEGILSSLMSGYVERAQDVTVASEPWKLDVGAKIVNRNEDRLRDLFSEEDRERVVEGTRTAMGRLASMPWI